MSQEGILEKEIATHSSILAWRVPWTEKPGGLQSMGVAKSRTGLSDFTFTCSLANIWWRTKLLKFLSDTYYIKC